MEKIFIQDKALIDLSIGEQITINGGSLQSGYEMGKADGAFFRKALENVLLLLPFFL